MSGITLDDPEAYFEVLARFEAEHWWSTALWRIVAHWIDRFASGRTDLVALDVGSGAGLTLARLSARVEVARAIGIEPSREALAHASRRRIGSLVRGSAIDLPFAPESFDIITCLDVLQHLPEEGDVRAAAEILRVLRPGGLAIVRGNAESLRPAQLRQLFATETSRVVKASHANMVGSLAQEARGRMWGRRHQANPAQGGLPRPATTGWSDRLMRVIGRAEAFAVGRMGVTLPFGHSTIALVQKGPFDPTALPRSGRFRVGKGTHGGDS
jgi:SAM-dependent methyltransferase